MAFRPRPGSRKDHSMTASDPTHGARPEPPAPPAPAAPAQARQGDVLLVPVDGIPAAARPVRRTIGRVILAEGEVTGHAHAIRSPAATLLRAGDERYLRVAAPVTLDHEEHARIEVAPGTYRVVIQREYVPPEISPVAFRPVVD
jgi:hypothetical protein